MAPPGPSVRGLAGLPPASCPPLGRSGHSGQMAEREQRWSTENPALGHHAGRGRWPWGTAWACLAQGAAGLEGSRFARSIFS